MKKCCLAEMAEERKHLQGLLSAGCWSTEVSVIGTEKKPHRAHGKDTPLIRFKAPLTFLKLVLPVRSFSTFDNFYAFENFFMHAVMTPFRLKKKCTVSEREFLPSVAISPQNLEFKYKIEMWKIIQGGDKKFKNYFSEEDDMNTLFSFERVI